jgi:hypothetical protein
MRNTFVISLGIVLAATWLACGRNDSDPLGNAAPEAGDEGIGHADAGSLVDGGSDVLDGGGDVLDGGPVAACTGERGGVPYSKYKWAFFGNLHQHTANSLDAYSFGTRVTPADAYLFAKGQKSVQIGPTGGPAVSLDRPLDFLAITDHSEFLGVVEGCNDPASPYYTSVDCTRIRSTSLVDQDFVFQNMWNLYGDLCGTGSATAAACTAAQRTAWLDEQMAAANAYEPCRFTSLVAYEWSAESGIDNHHRNVIFANDVVPTNPLDSLVYPTTTELFAQLDQKCTGSCAAIVAPHNTNRSNGTSLVLPSSPAELDAWQRYQRLIEIYQHKGASECFYDPDGGAGGGAPADPNCAFEYLSHTAAPDTPDNYVRTALEKGIGYAVSNASQNPLELGIIASTDDHNGIAGYAKEDAYVGHMGRLDDQAANRLMSFPDWGSGGPAVVWAEENTREAIFAALVRRETYGTSGPRLILRFYETTAGEPCTADFPRTIIDSGTAVPMGGKFRGSDLTGKLPTFVIGAWPDTQAQHLADGTIGVAGIATVQILKAHGKKVITEDAPVGVTIAPMGQCLAWRDPGFDPTEHAFYYVRVLQVPTWRWSHFDCQTMPQTSGCEPGGALDVAIQERAWTSPIWYVP